jgi:gluconate kinase
MRIACFIFGSPGSGKTYITKYINKLLGVGDIAKFNMSIDDRVLNIKEYQKKIINKIKYSQSDNIEDLSDLSSKIYYDTRRIYQNKILNEQINDLKKFIKNPNCLVTIEATMIKENDIYQCDLKGTYLDILKSAGFKVVFLYLYNDLETIKTRIMKRNQESINTIRNNTNQKNTYSAPQHDHSVHNKKIHLVPYKNILKSRELVLDTIKYLLCKKRDNDIIILYNNKLAFYYNSKKNTYKNNIINKQTNNGDKNKFIQNIFILKSKIDNS